MYWINLALINKTPGRNAYCTIFYNGEAFCVNQESKMAVTTGYNLPYDSAKLIEPKLYINGYCVLAGVLTWIVDRMNYFGSFWEKHSHPLRRKKILNGRALKCMYHIAI
jgi:hypothetical protein